LRERGLRTEPMTHTPNELTDAIRAVGRTGEPFTSAAVRAQLGINTEERRALTRFNSELRAYCKLRPDLMVQLGKNRYCLLEAEEAEPEQDRPRLPRRVTIRITLKPVRTPAPEPVRPRIWSWFAALLRPTLRLPRESH
jgi:hypothetical protein